jgi:uncharacterized protein YdeI (BOF family)
MKKVGTFISVLTLALISTTSLMAQSVGDYRTRASGDWSSAQIWQRFNGASWLNAGTPPTGAETITVQSADSIFVNTAVSITGTLVNRGIVEADSNLTIANGGTYQHDRDGGKVPISIWAEGSTMLVTGVTGTAPNDRDQDYYNLTFNTPNLGANLHMNLNGNTIGGAIRVINTASARWYLTSASIDSTRIVTIMGDVIVEGGQFSVQGTGNARTTFIVHHYGNVIVTGGNFSIARGSQGSGSGSTHWYLHEGNFSMSNASTQNSNPTPGNAKLVFAKNDTQKLAFENVTYAGGRIHFEVADSATLQITKDFVANGNLVNRGAIQSLGVLTFANGAVYEHARDGGSVPSAVWQEGSTALFTGITGTAPANRGQDYYNLTLNTPSLTSNRDLALDGKTIGGDLTVISTGTARWQMVGSASGTVTIKGNVIVQAGQFTTQGTSSATNVVIEHFGSINVTGGNFSISRGSQSNGTGTTTWNLREGNFSMSNATTQNSNPTAGKAKFVFAKKGGTQNLTLANVTYQTGGLPIQIDSAATVKMDTSRVGGSGIFTLSAGATLASGHPNGIAGNLQTQNITLSEGANYVFNGATAQVTSALMPKTVNGLAIDNKAGVTLSQATTINDKLRLMAGVFDNTIPFTLGPSGSISYEGGSLKVTVAVKSRELNVPKFFFVAQNYPNPFSAQRHGHTSTAISFGLPSASPVTVEVFNVLGQKVATLFNGRKDAGMHTLQFEAANLSAGVYLYRIQAGDFVSVKRMMLTK